MGQSIPTGIFSTCMLLLFSCTPKAAKAEFTVYTYDEQKKSCFNQSGREGLNPFQAEIVFAGLTPDSRGVTISKRKAQCINFSGVAFQDYIGTGYNILEDWDFRGSDFSKAEILFNFIVNGQFAGSKLEGLSIGYGRVTAQDIDFNEGDMPLPKK